MPVNRPRRPRGPRRPTPLPGANAQAYASAAQKGWDFAAKLEAIAAARKRQQEAPPIHTPRPSPTQERSRRMVSAQELFNATTTPSRGMPSAEELLAGDWDDHGPRPIPLDDFDTPFGSGAQVYRMPTAQELLEGTWEAQPETPTSTEYYSPTRSSYPFRPRTLEMSYNRETRLMRVVFRDGGTYDYFDVPGSIWYRVRQVKSPGRFLDRNVIGRFDYEKVAH